MRSAQRREIIRPSLQLVLSVADAAVEMRVSTAMIRKSITSGDLRAVRYGRRCLVRRSELEEFINRLPARTTSMEVGKSE